MSGQANPNPQQEPTMEEILASIRKIISEDQPAESAKAPAKAPAPKPQLVAVEPTATPPAVAVAPPSELDVLDLTEEVTEEVSQPPASATPAPAVADDDVVFQTAEPEPAPKSAAPIAMSEEPPMEDDLISDSARHAMGQAFSNLNGGTPHVTLRGGSIESLFTDAIQQAFRPALKEWIDGHSNEVMDELRPLIRAWMDEHLPPLVQAAVAKEISRAAERARKA